MALVSPGLSGRRDTADGKLPPGQHLTVGFAVLSAGPARRCRSRSGSSPSRREAMSSGGGTGNRYAVCLPRRSPPICTRDALVEARNDMGGRFARYALRRSEDGRCLRTRLLIRRLHDESAVPGVAGGSGASAASRSANSCPRGRSRSPGAISLTAPQSLAVRVSSSCPGRRKYRPRMLPTTSGRKGFAPSD